MRIVRAYRHEADILVEHVVDRWYGARVRPLRITAIATPDYLSHLCRDGGRLRSRSRDARSNEADSSAERRLHYLAVLVVRVVAEVQQ